MTESQTLDARPAVLGLDQIHGQEAGGKAWGLARLQRLGLRVPPAFIVQYANRALPDEAELAARLADLGDVPVAVRSSAEGEDGGENSFAGQYETVLNVEGAAAVRRAIAHCVASADSERARAYRGQQDVAMHVVVQTMVDAHAAGVTFTADPVSARRELCVIDAVAGLGEALVSGEATPDHFAVDSDGRIVRRQLAADEAVLGDPAILKLAEQARDAAERLGQPLDLEWAIDANGELYWLQARPITSLPADLNEFDTRLPRPDDVLTRCNIGEMMPGAVCPLTTSFTGWGIDYGCQHMQIQCGARQHIEPDWQITASAYGHLFINLTGNTVMCSAVLGSTVDQTAQTLCGRPVPELVAPRALPFWRRLLNFTRLLRYLARAPRVVEEFTRELQGFSILYHDNSRDMMRELVERAPFYNHCMAVHLQSSALAGFLTAILERMVSADKKLSTGEAQGETIRLLSGADGVESAVMLEELDQLVDRIAQEANAGNAFQAASSGRALAWLREHRTLGPNFAGFIARHGHRGYRELCMRDPSWCDNPLPLIQSMQAAVNSRLLTGSHGIQKTVIDWRALSRGLRWLLPRAHNAVRRREQTKSQLALLSNSFKRAFRHLGELLAAEGKLPDADLVSFFAFAELPDFVQSPDAARVDTARQRREALAYQQRLSFPEISVGLPQPLEPQIIDVSDGILQGRPACRGVVEGRARVAHTLDQAAALQPGEILVTPITDIGWTPYFSLIGGLITDLGSAVSHGAVIAREYGLPCVVNARHATGFLKTGDTIRLDGNNGTVTLIERASPEA